MYPSSIYYKRLTDKAIIKISYEDTVNIENTLKAKMYPVFESPNNVIIRLPLVKTIWNKIPEWQHSPKMWQVPKGQTTANENGMEIKVSVWIAIVLFEICEASNSKNLLRLKGNIHDHLKDNFNLILPITTDNLQ